MAETFPYIGSLDVVHKGQDPKVDQMLIRSFGLNSTLARAYLNTEQAGLTSAATTKVLLDTESFDLGSNFASNKYVAPVTGYYQVNWNAYIRGDGGALTGGVSYLYQDGAAVSYGAYAAGADILSPGSDLIYVVAASYLELYAVGTTSSSTWKIENGAAGTFMTVHLVARA